MSGDRRRGSQSQPPPPPPSTLPPRPSYPPPPQYGGVPPQTPPSHEMQFQQQLMPPPLQSRPFQEIQYPQMQPFASQPVSGQSVSPPGAGAMSSFHQHSLSSGSSSYGEPYRPGPSSMESPTSSSYPSQSLSAHKRAFRQRRKDPSCDACRERKVKCDATDTMSCSECTSRGVKCQFTKETNRRMSSLKQVQDLERQLNAARQQNRQLRSMLEAGASTSEAMDIEPSVTQSVPPSFPTTGETTASTAARPSRSFRYDTCRRNVRRAAKGIFEPPPSHRSPIAPRRLREEDALAPPPKAIADELVTLFLSSFHASTPVIDRPAFTANYERLYASSSFRGFSHVWAAQYFAILGIGYLQSRRKYESWNSSSLLDEALTHMRSAEDETSLEYCRAAILISHLGWQTGRGSVGRRWLAMAMSCAIEQGLNRNLPGTVWNASEGEMRQRLWLCIYASDRLQALELGKPFQVEDEDCDVTPINIQQQEREGRTQAEQATPTPLELMVPLLQLATDLRNELRQKPSSMQRQAELNSAIERLSASLPDPYNPDSLAYLDLSHIWMVTAIANMQILLYRPSLSPYSDQQQRSMALSMCAAAAQKTARAINRSMQTAPYTDATRSAMSWDERARLCATTMLCAHLWRCILILALWLDIPNAMACQKLSAAIGSLRRTNVACGRYTIMFLTQMRDRIRKGQVRQREEMLADEELVAYATGDLQGSGQAAWIWEDEAGGEVDEGQAGGEGAPGEAMGGDGGQEMPEELVWDRVHYLLSEVRKEQQQRPGLQAPPAPAVAVAGAPARLPGESSAGSGASGGMSERMSIASILDAPDRGRA